MPSINTNLLLRNSDYRETVIDGDPVLSLKLYKSYEHFIKDDASPSYTYTSYFTLINKLPVSLDEVSVFLSTGETPDQANIQTYFETPSGPNVFQQINIGHLEPNATSLRQSFTIKIVRVMPFGKLNNFTLNFYYNPTYKVSYDNNQDMWNAPSQVIVES